MISELSRARTCLWDLSCSSFQSGSSVWPRSRRCGITSPVPIYPPSAIVSFRPTAALVPDSSDTSTMIGARDAAALTNGFALAARSSEAALLDWEDAVEADEGQGLLYDLYRPKVTNDQPLGATQPRPLGNPGSAATCQARPALCAPPPQRRPGDR